MSNCFSNISCRMTLYKVKTLICRQFMGVIISLVQDNIHCPVVTGADVFTDVVVKNARHLPFVSDKEMMRRQVWKIS